MKKIVLLVTILFCGCSFSPDPILTDSERELILYYDFETLLKDELFNRSLSWVVDSYNSPKSVIEFKDKEMGKIVITGETNFEWNSFAGSALPHICKYKFILDIKDKRIRLTFTDFYGTMPDYRGGVEWEPMIYKSHIESVKKQLLLYGDSLSKYINRFGEKDW